MAFLDKNYWTKRYSAGETGWDIGFASPPLMQYLDQIENKAFELLIPGAGSAYEAVYAFRSGIEKVHILDFSNKPLELFKSHNPTFPVEQIHHEDFFLHTEKYDLILEQTFFCALNPELRANYALKMKELLNPGGKLVGVWFDREFGFDGPPFGGKLEQYKKLFEKHFEVKIAAPCYNSIPERLGSEVFMILVNSEV
tara:strand:+ start:210 stop:800 length:591 start_codon:yes stop_codon:yes gene_type:complete